jgi:hypothetical protein
MRNVIDLITGRSLANPNLRDQVAAERQDVH